MQSSLHAGTLQSDALFLCDFPIEEDFQKNTLLGGPRGEDFDRLLHESNLLTTPKGNTNYYKWLRELREERTKSICIASIFDSTPEGGDISSWCISKNEANLLYEGHRKTLVEEYPNFEWPPVYNWTHIGTNGKYIHPQYLGCIPKFLSLLEKLPNLNLVVALGALPCWLLLNDPGIKSNRGYVTMSTLVPTLKVLPTFEIDHLNKVYQDRVIFLADMGKAKKNKSYPNIEMLERTVWINPTIEDLYKFEDLYLKDVDLLSVDIETAYGYRMPLEQVACIGFAPTTEISLVVPFIDPLKKGYTYWKNPEDEILAWKWVYKILISNTKKLGQNFNFDLQYLWQKMGMPVLNVTEDLMLAHHSLQPEMLKSLEFLGSVYSDTRSWKGMGKKFKRGDQGG